MVNILNIKCVDEDEEESLSIQMGMIADLIATQFKNLTIPEIQESMKMYVSKKFDIKVFRLLDCVSIGEILTAYINFRNESTKVFVEKRKKEIIEDKVISESEKQKIMEDYLKMVFNEITETGFCSDAYQLFTYFESSGKIKQTKEEKKELYQKELKKYELEEKSFIRNKYDALVVGNYLRELSNKITSKTPIESVANRCRSILVSNHLKNFIDNYEFFKKECNH